MPIFRHKDAHRSTRDPHRPQTADLEQRTRQIAADMLARARDRKLGFLSTRFYSDKLMNWSMKDHDFKVQLFRFVDVFPVLNTPEMIHDILVDYLSQPGVNPPPGIDLGLRAGAVAKGLMGKTIESQIRAMARKFIAGTDAADALPTLRKLWNDNIAFSVDLLGEACISDEEADEYRDKYLDLIENLPETVDSWNEQPLLTRDHLGEIPRTNVSIKISSLSGKVDPIDTEASIERLMTRLMPILETARDRGVFVNFDMEHHELKDLTLTLFERCCETIDFHAGLAMQAYLRSAEDDARRITRWAREKNRTVTIRLVKGAYWDFETIHAELMGWPCPVWNEKHLTDACFERVCRILLDACPTRPDQGGTKLALGSHNVRSIAAALAYAERRELPRQAVEIQMLHGMAEPLKHAAKQMDLRVREYVPVGEMIPGMAYLVRRLLENTSNESWLKAGFLDQADEDTLLRDPASITTRNTPDLADIAPERHDLSPAIEGVGDAKPFSNEPVRDFAREDHRRRFAQAVRNARVDAPPSTTSPRQAVEMVARARDLFPVWRDTNPITRSNILVRIAHIMRDRRDELSAVMVKEACKTWREADADTCEAIDFCEYYARCAPPLFTRTRMGRFIGELDEYFHQPKGPAVVISPWNFPLAISTGMTVASLVTGNTTILKPAEQTTAIAHELARIIRQALREADLDEDIFQLCCAPGETTGAALVRDPRVHLIAFTGSKAVGLDIIHAAAQTPQSPDDITPPASAPDLDLGSLYPQNAFPQTFVKRVICEMGGKNALIIDTSADLDEAVVAVRYSAFGFQGQKCSACSRCIVVDEQGPDGPHMTLFLKRLVNATRVLRIGDPAHPDTDIAPVIDTDAAQRIRRYIQIARDEGCTLELALELPDDDPFVRQHEDRFIPPHIFSAVTPEHTIAREEIFGPVLAVMHARNFDHALEIANDCPYKLTAGVFTRKPAHIERAKNELRVGNLYINRGITGAIVARHPFGGFAMSGVGSKAGGPHYLHQFVEPRATAENTMRRGFAPEL